MDIDHRYSVFIIWLITFVALAFDSWVVVVGYAYIAFVFYVASHLAYHFLQLGKFHFFKAVHAKPCCDMIHPKLSYDRSPRDSFLYWASMSFPAIGGLCYFDQFIPAAIYTAASGFIAYLRIEEHVWIYDNLINVNKG